MRSFEIPRLPASLRTRWVYAFVSGISGVAFAVIFLAIIAFPSESHFDVKEAMKSALFALGAVPAAALAWPKRAPRPVGRMVVAGLITVILSFVLLGLFLGLFIGVTEGENAVQVIGNTLGMIATITVFGSIFTLGLPYLFGALLSVPFSNSRK